MEQIAKMYKRGLSLSEIADRTFYGESTVRRALEVMGIPRRRGRKRLIPENKVPYVHEMYNQGLGFTEIGRVMGVDEGVIRYLINGRRDKKHDS